MRQLLSRAGLIGLAILSGAVVLRVRASAATLGTPEPDIIVGANVRVSHDGDFAHIETPIAVSPVDPDLMIAGATVFPPDVLAHDRAYVSSDQGVTWRAIILPSPVEHGSGDPMVEIGLTGTLYFVTIDFGLEVGTAYRSADSGRSWEGPVKLGRMDRDILAVDHSAGRFSGRVYVSGVAKTAQGFGAAVYYSSDDGRTYRRGGTACMNGVNVSLTILSDGALLVICTGSQGGTLGLTLGFSMSTDGGETFSAYRPIAHTSRFPEALVAPLQRAGAVLLPRTTAPSPAPCVADVHTAQFRDRLYCFWDEPDSATLTSRIYLTWSGDKGATWSAPRAVAAAAPGWATQAMPSAAVNQDGVLGLAWFDTRASKARDRCDVFFTASRDGGVTFLPPVRVTSASSFPMGRGNIRPSVWSPIVDSQIQGGTAHITGSPFAYRPLGGDYAGMAVTRSGEFQPVWPDARNGTWQVYSARIRVAHADESLVRGLPRPAERMRTSLTGKTTVRIESATVDSAPLEMTFWAHIRNISSDTLYGPFAVEVVPRRFWADYMRREGRPLPTPVGASGRESGDVIRFEYEGAAGTLDLLPPGGVTESRPWRFHSSYPAVTELQMQTTVTGFVRKPSAAP